MPRNIFGAEFRQNGGNANGGIEITETSIQIQIMVSAQSNSSNNQVDVTA